jgi:hypothetical protein
MKKIFFILILFSSKIYSQNLTGTWNVISYEDEIVYYNKIKDSISYKIPSQKEEADSFKEMSDFLIFALTYKFDNNKNFSFNHSTFGEISSCQFEIDELNKKIILLDKKSKQDEIPYDYINEILFMEIKLKDNDNIKIGLKKSI